MPTFLLVPREETADDLDWEASLHTGPCTVVAPDERSARRYADGAFCRAVIESRPDRPRPPASPWSQPRLVRAEVVTSPPLADAALPEGVVQVRPGEGETGPGRSTASVCF